MLVFSFSNFFIFLFDISREKLLHSSHICIDIWLHIWHQRAVLLCGMLSGVHLLISSCCLATLHLVTFSSSLFSFVSAIHMEFSGCKKFKVICVLHLDAFIYISGIPLLLVKSESLNAVKWWAVVTCSVGWKIGVSASLIERNRRGEPLYWINIYIRKKKVQTNKEKEARFVQKNLLSHL